MRPLRPVPSALGALALAAVLLAGATARPQEAKDANEPKPVEILSVDGVELKGFWYPQNRQAATVLMLHAIGEDCKKAEWISLAKALHAKGYAVFRFDFRGHGDSTGVKPGVPNANPALAVRGFWDEAENRQLVRGFVGSGPRKTSIDLKGFGTGYHKFLVNDIAAAKTFLDEKNDAGECNSGNLILLGAKDGATLAALWLNAELHRYRLFRAMPPKTPRPTPDLANPEGNAVSAVICLSVSGTLGGSRVNVPSMLYKAGVQNKVPMAFFYADGDSKGKETALHCEKVLKPNKKDYALTGAVKVPNGDKFSGVQLLAKSLGTEKGILDYLENALQGKNVQAKNRDGKEDRYVWQWQQAGGQVRQIIARYEKSSQVVFSNYSQFLR
jgi:pimeloyl-ACP methyl ester carboxylesterase